MVEMIRCGNGFLWSRQVAQHAMLSGWGNVDLLLTPEQYAPLAKRAWPMWRSMSQAVNGAFTAKISPIYRRTINCYEWPVQF